MQAVKDKNYAHAITLFEEQAKLPRHDAQYNLAVLLNAGKGRPRNYVDALYWSWQAQLGEIEDAEDLAMTLLIYCRQRSLTRCVAASEKH